MNILMGTLSKGGEVEVLEKPQRRRFTLEYKRRIVREVDRCQKPGEVGAMLRREGLYSSHLSSWRAARDRGELGGGGRRKRGPEPKAPDPSAKRVAELERENRRLRKRAERAEGLAEVQKNSRSCWASNLRRTTGPPDDRNRRGLIEEGIVCPVIPGPEYSSIQTFSSESPSTAWKAGRYSAIGWFRMSASIRAVCSSGKSGSRSKSVRTKRSISSGETG